MLAPIAWAEGIEGATFRYFSSGIGVALIGAFKDEVLVLGGGNQNDAINAFNETGITWGLNYRDNDSEVYSAVYVANPYDVNFGNIIAGPGKNSVSDLDDIPMFTVMLKEGSILMVNGAAVDATENPAINAAIYNFRAKEVSDAKLFILNAKANHTYKIFEGDGLQDTSFERVFTNNKLLKFNILNDSAYYNVTAYVDIENPLIKDSGLKSLVTEIANADESTELSSQAELVKHLIDTNPTTESARNAVASLANFSELAGSTHGTYTTALLTSDLAQDHLSIAHHTKVMKKDLWAVYSHSNESVDGLTLTKQKADYEGSYHSYVIGSDLYEKDNFVLGVAGSYSTGKISSRHNAVSTKNEAKYYGASIYGRKINGKTSYLADLSYLHGSNDITQRNTGEVITGKPKTNAISLGIKAEQEFTTAHGSFIPYAGIRYMHLSQGDYKTSAGFSYEQDDQNLFLIPMGVKFTTERKVHDWNVKPMAEVGLVINTGDKDTKATISDGTNVDALDYTIVNGTSILGKLVVQAEKENLTLGVSYRYQKSSDTSDNRFQLNFGYKF